MSTQLSPPGPCRPSCDRCGPPGREREPGEKICELRSGECGPGLGPGTGEGTQGVGGTGQGPGHWSEPPTNGHTASLSKNVKFQRNYPYIGWRNRHESTVT